MGEGQPGIHLAAPHHPPIPISIIPSIPISRAGYRVTHSSCGEVTSPSPSMLALPRA
jgi:hypothetical protein